MGATDQKMRPSTPWRRKSSNLSDNEAVEARAGLRFRSISTSMHADPQNRLRPVFSIVAAQESGVVSLLLCP